MRLQPTFSTVFFVCGRPGYKVISPERNVVALFTKCVWVCMLFTPFFINFLTNYILFVLQTMATKDTHVARVRYGNVFVSEVNAVLKVCVLFLTYPLFWALYDQQVGVLKCHGAALFAFEGSRTVLALLSV